MNTRELSLLERIQTALNEFGITPNALAKSNGLVQVTVNDQLRGKNKISVQTIEAVLNQITDLSAEWLLRGEGDMLKADATPLPLAEVTQELNSNNEEELANLREQLDQQKEFNALQKEYVADLKERIKEYQDRVAELKEHIHELKKEHHSASVHHAKNA